MTKARMDLGCTFTPAKGWCKRGVRGEGSFAAGSPRSYTAEIDLWHRGPSRAPVPHEAQRAE